MKNIFIFLFFLPNLLFSQVHLPLASQTPPKGTSHREMIKFLKDIVQSSKLIELEIPAKSVEKRQLPVVFIPKKYLWKKNKTTVMLFAEQHGDEPSGKEALLMLIHQIYTMPKQHFYNNLNLILIPMVNPDGNESYQRRNANHVDLNRNHLILTEPETQLLHSIFDKYKPEITIDIHEYGIDTWIEHGYLKDFGEQLDCISNPAIPEEFKEFALKEILNPTLILTRARGIKANRYLICRPELDHFVRHSTTDIDDGRNSFGMQYTLSFILEGLNGLSKEDKIWERAKHQLTLIENFLNICDEKSKTILNFVNQARINYAEAIPESIAIQADFTNKCSTDLKVVLKRTSDLKDTTIILTDYRPQPEVIVSVKRPEAYVIEDPGPVLKELLQNQGFYYQILNAPTDFSVEQFIITSTNTLEYESNEIIIPEGVFVSKSKTFDPGTIILPTNNIRANQIVEVFEPQSFYGISHYDKFKYLLKGRDYPIYRLIKK